MLASPATDVVMHYAETGYRFPICVFDGPLAARRLAKLRVRR